MMPSTPPLPIFGGPEASTENSWDTLLDDDDDEIYDTMSADTFIAVTTSVPVV